MNDLVANILVLIAQIVVIFAVLSQYIHIISKKNNIKGLSGWTYTLITGSTIAWGIYGVRQGIEVFYYTSFIVLLIEFSILGHLYVSSKLRRRMEIYAISVGLSLAFLLYRYPEYSGWIGLVYTALARLPQYKHLLVDRNLRGISTLAHTLFIIANTLTIIYATHFTLLPVVLSASLAIGSSIFLLFMVAKKSIRPYN